MTNKIYRPDRVRPAASGSFTTVQWDELRQYVWGSWHDRFSFRSERLIDGRREEGLRQPQIGALHAALAHWVVTDIPATIVMPTGTGKTETMLALLVSQRLERLLVVVPNNALRQQVGEKFRTLGVLKDVRVLAADAVCPIVGVLEHRPEAPTAVEAFFDCCNVVVTTMQVLSGCSEGVQQAIVGWCTHLFIDEAHHVAAPTWDGFRRRFAGKPVLQFTATPYRTDRKPIGGKPIFTYPLSLAQQEGYFKPITFRPVWALVDSDRAIAQAALTQLRADLDRNLDHIVMARVASISRAVEVHRFYSQEAAEYSPLLIHSKLSRGAKREALSRLGQRSSRVIVCVDMLGEGFDLPELKIAALHDVHKSLAVTLQFIGRFTRVNRPTIGNATVVANVADVRVNKALEELYAEDADWNVLLCPLADGATEQAAQRNEFIGSFVDPPSEVPTQNVRPKMSTVVYRTDCTRWRPKRIAEAVDEHVLYTQPTVSDRHRVAWFVTRETEEIPWGTLRELENVAWHLYLLHWDEERRLLFINSSNKNSVHEKLAEVVAGESASLIRGEQVYRAMHGIKRLVPSNVGLSHAAGRNIRHSQHMGIDVPAGLGPTGARNRVKSNVFGRGYEGGGRVSVGCSQKGRIWSHLVADDISGWVAWCHRVADKLLDERINVEDIFSGFLIPKALTARPPLVPLAIEWPVKFLACNEETVQVVIGGESRPFYETGLQLIDHTNDGPIRFRVSTDHGHVEYELRFTTGGTRYRPLTVEAELVIGKTRRPLSEWFRLHAPTVYFERDAYIEDDLFFQLRVEDRQPFPVDRIAAWDWTGVDITKESQGLTKEAGSVQRRVIEHLLTENDWDIIFDDDDSYEAADVVALGIAGNRLRVRLYHCKYSGETTAGARVNDLYAVCGQAQRSVYWRNGLDRLLQHLAHRQKSRDQANKPPRFERGDLDKLNELRRRLPHLMPDFEVAIVQPGLSKSGASGDQLELLAATALYLADTFDIKLEVIASE